MKVLLGIVFISYAIGVQAQPAEPVSYNSASDSLLSLYQANLGTNLPLYNGRQFYGYLTLTKYSPLYPDEADWSIGSVLYDNMWYRNLLIKYDIYKDQVIIRHLNGIPYILYSDRVQEFSFEGKTFIRIHKDKSNSMLTDGFYQRLLAGKVILLAKRSKTMEEDKFGRELERKFIFKSQFYVVKDNSFTFIRKHKSLLTLLNDKNRELRLYIKKNKLKYRSNRELYITQAVDFYNNL